MSWDCWLNPINQSVRLAREEFWYSMTHYLLHHYGRGGRRIVFRYDQLLIFLARIVEFVTDLSDSTLP